MKGLRIIVTGGRDLNDLPLLMDKCIEIIATVTKEDNTINKIRIISGGARGADKLGEQYAQIAHYGVSRFPATRDIYGKSAGHRRDTDMAKFASGEESIGTLIAFWDGKSRGTKHMINLAKRYGLDVYVINHWAGRKLWIHGVLKMRVEVEGKIYIPTDKRPYTVKTKDNGYIVCTEPFNLRHTVLYFIIDLKDK